MFAEPSSKMVPECPDHRRSERLNSGNIAAHSPRAGSNLGADDAHSDDHDLRAGPQIGGKAGGVAKGAKMVRSEEHTSELQSLMRISYAVFCLTTKKSHTHKHKR